MSPIRVDEDLLPTSVFAIHLTRLNQPAGWLVGEFSLEEMWRMVDQIRIGDHGFAMVVAPGGELIAHGDPDKKALVAQTRNMSGHQLFAAARARTDAAPVSQEYIDEDGRSQLGVAARIAQLGWTVIVEQPTREAYANATALQRQLVVAISVALLVHDRGRLPLRPQLHQPDPHAAARHPRRRRRPARRARRRSARDDEFGDLGDAFNTMADRLVELQEEVKRQERQAMFGRVAAGLVHDLSHPIQNIGNSTRLLLRDDLDAGVARAVPPDHRARAAGAQALHGRPAPRRQAEADRALRDGRQRHRSPRSSSRCAPKASATASPSRRTTRRAAGHRGRSLRARPRLPQPHHQRDSGDRARRPRHHRDRPRRRSGRDQRHRHRLGHPGRAALARSSTTSSRPSAAASASAWRSRSASSSSSTARSTSQSEVGRGTAFTLRFPARDDRTAQAAAS